MAHSRRDYCHDFRGQDTVHENPAIYLIGIQQQVGYLHRCLDFDIPYTAGLDLTGQVYFRDRGVPDCPPFVDPTLHDVGISGVAWIDIPWMIHESTEWDNMHNGGKRRLSYLVNQWLQTKDSSLLIPQEDQLEYQPAHQLALEAEKGFVTFWGVDWAQYNAWCDTYIARADSLGHVQSVPPILDLTPYEDECAQFPDEIKTLQKIADCGGPKSYMLYDKGVRGGSDGKPFNRSVG